MSCTSPKLYFKGMAARFYLKASQSSYSQLFPRKGFSPSLQRHNIQPPGSLVAALLLRVPLQGLSDHQTNSSGMHRCCTFNSASFLAGPQLLLSLPDSTASWLLPSHTDFLSGLGLPLSQPDRTAASHTAPFRQFRSCTSHCQSIHKVCFNVQQSYSIYISSSSSRQREYA